MAQLPYTDLATVKAYLSLSDSDTTQDTFLSNVIVQIQGFIDRYTKRTFGWGDSGDTDEVDYSNSDNVGISTATIDETNTFLTISTMGTVNWVANQNVALFGMANAAWNGVWAVTEVINAVTLVINVAISTGSLTLSEEAVITNNPANFTGYIGNAVKNYRYKSTNQFDGLVGQTIWLRDMDIRSIDSVYIGLRNIAQPTLLNPTQYVWRNDGRVILGGAYFNSFDSSVYTTANDNAFYGSIASGYQTIMINYWHGHIGVPEELQLATCDLVAAMYTLRRSLGIQQERAGDYEVRYDILFRKALATQPDSLNVLNILRRRHIS